MNTKAFYNLIIPLQDKLFRFAVSILKNTAESEDALQETMTKLWERRNDLQKYNNLSAYAMKMIKNDCINRLRNAKKISGTPDNDLMDGLQNPHKQIEIKDTAGMAQNLIEQLPYMQQMVMRLRDVEEYELDEIADIMEISPNAVRTNLSRARQTVRQQLSALIS